MVANLAREWSARLIGPVARLLGKWGLTPNAVTILGFFLTAMVAVVIATGRTQLASILLIFTLAFDAVDGTLARLMGATSRFGAFLDSTLDRWAEIALYSALVWLFLENGQDKGVLLAVAAMATSLLVSYTRARAEGVGYQCKEGILTRFERLVILIVGLFLGQIIWALGIIAVLAGITAIQRIWVTWQLARAEG
jgi:CDP-diacylglycerol---glycerol-3-phosphate 3-phosphatidyltransferase